MQKSRFGLALGLSLPLCLFAHSYGPPPRVTAAPGDNPRACTQCHSRGVLNGGPGSVQILLQSGPVYIPGVKQHITVQVSDPDQKRWGFEMSARLDSDPENSMAGEFLPIDNWTQVICQDGGPKPCAGGPTFITHTAAATRPGTSDGATFRFDWMPPAQDSGPITLYVAGNAANGDNSFTGDQIYTSSVQLMPANPSAPVVSADRVVVMANLAPGNMSPNSWVTVQGTNLGVTTRNWSDDDFVDGGFPYSLDGVSVILTSLGTPRLAYVGYVSPTQINFLLPIDLLQGPTTMQVRNPAGASAAVPITIRTTAPQLLTVDGKSVKGVHADGTPLGKTSPVAALEFITINATGLGQTDPPLVTAQLPDGPTPLARLPQVTIGSAQAVVKSAVVTTSPGMYEITLQVPSGLASGDQPVVCQIGNTSSNAAMLTVGQ
jgi:uncharacterized protein (TIGR03437 family)